MTSLKHAEGTALITRGLPETAARIVSEMLGARTRSAELLREGLMTFKCRVRTERGDDIMVRFYPASRSTVVQQEPGLLERCCQAGLLVPQLLGDSRTGPKSPLDYIVYNRISGTTLETVLPLCSEDERLRLAQELAQQLFKFQDIHFQGAGELTSFTSAQKVEWKTFVNQSIHTGLDAIRRHALLDAALLERIAQVVDREVAVLDDKAQLLIWGDINFGNILVGDDRHIAGLIDFESCLSGDPLATLGYGYAAHGKDPFFSLLLSAWPRPLASGDHDLIALYAILRALRLAPYAHLQLPTGKARDPLVEIFPGIIPAVCHLGGHSY